MDAPEVPGRALVRAARLTGGLPPGWPDRWGWAGDEFEGPFLVDHGRFARAFGDHPPLEEAVRYTVRWFRGHPRQPWVPALRVLRL